MKDEMVLNNVNLIYIVLKKLNLYNRVDDFYDIAMIGLIKGVKKYDESKGYKVSTYLCSCIRNEILMSFRKINSGREVPENAILPLSTPIGDNLTFEDMIQDDVNVEDELIKNEKIELLYKEISKLSKQEQLVINLSFGLNGCEKTRQKEIAKNLNKSQAQVSRIKLRALKKLRKAMSNYE